VSAAVASRLGWYVRRVARTSPAAVAVPARELTFTAVLPAATAARVPEEARNRMLEAADRLLLREQAGIMEQARELSPLQHLTLLATAWFLTQDERYAQRVADHLRPWWQENPFLTRVHRTTRIEFGICLISLAWIRRLLNDWPGVTDLFERDAHALRQIGWHQQYLAAFLSRGSSAGHDIVAGAAGQLVASCAFPWFRESERWRRNSTLLLERELIRITFPSGVGRERSSDYQCFIAELGFVAAVEADANGHPLRPATWARLCALADSAAALTDERLRPPRQGDFDEGRALLLDAPTPNRWPSMLALAEALVGQQDWWPRSPANTTSSIFGALAGRTRQIEGRPNQRPSHFADAGITLLRTSGENEIWCRCDGGPDGYRSVAAHAHADALSVEVRYAGVDILANPGTFCGREDHAWRSYFRSTIAHNTAELGGRGQSGESRPFARARHAQAREIEVLDDGDIARWTAEHDGYAPLDPPALHRRSVLLDRASRSIDIVDQIDGGRHNIRLAFHLGPDVHAEWEESCAALYWPAAATPGAARLELPSGLRWSLHRGETDPILGWYSHSLGRRVPAVTLLGCGRCVPGIPFITRLEFLEVGQSGKPTVSLQALSWTTSATRLGKAPEMQAEAR